MFFISQDEAEPATTTNTGLENNEVSGQTFSLYFSDFCKSFSSI